MDQPPQDPSQPSQPAEPAPPAPGPAWGQPAAPASPAPGPAWGQPAAPASPAPGPAWGQAAAPPAQQYAPPPAQQYAPPPAPSGWAQPAPIASQWVQPAGVLQGPVTGLAKIAGLIILLFGLGWTAVGALITFGGAVVSTASDRSGFAALGDAVGGIIAGLGIVILVLAIIELLGGIGILLSKGWGRYIGITYSLIFGAGSLLVALGGGRAQTTTTDVGPGVLIFGLVCFVLYGYSLIVLMARWRGRATA